MASLNLVGSKRALKYQRHPREHPSAYPDEVIVPHPHLQARLKVPPISDDIVSVTQATPGKLFTERAMTEMATTAGTNQRETRSASRCIGARLR